MSWSLKRSTIMNSAASSAVCYSETIAVECKCHLHYQNTERQLLERTFKWRQSMSAFGGKADIIPEKADIKKSPLVTQSGHRIDLGRWLALPSD